MRKEAIDDRPKYKYGFLHFLLCGSATGLEYLCNFRK
jgi:hypothetical protein